MTTSDPLALFPSAMEVVMLSCYRLVPFVLEEGARLFRECALAIYLSEIADIGAQAGKLKAPESCSCSNPKAASGYWAMRRWKQEVSG